MPRKVGIITHYTTADASPNMSPHSMRSTKSSYRGGQVRTTVQHHCPLVVNIIQNILLCSIRGQTGGEGEGTEGRNQRRWFRRSDRFLSCNSERTVEITNGRAAQKGREGGSRADGIDTVHNIAHRPHHIRDSDGRKGAEDPGGGLILWSTLDLESLSKGYPR